MGDIRIIRIEDKIDKLDSRLDKIDLTLAAQHVSLKDHIRRTEQNEADIKPIKRDWTIVHGIAKIAGAMAILWGAVEGVLKWLNGS